ncbi:MAG: hypothetical protein U0359_01605 [Byssovorax sp.]
MATISTLAVSTSYEELTGDISYTLVRCEARPLTAGLAPALVALLTDITTTQETERKLVLDLERAEVRVFLADEDIDSLIDGIVNTLLTLTGGDRTSDLYTFYLKDKTPGELKDPILDEELEAVRQWIDPLSASPHPALVTFAPLLNAAVDVADKAKAAFDTAAQALKTFREQGARKTLVDMLNAKRKATHGALGEIAHSHPELMLPGNFADRFFVRDQKKKKPGIKELQARLDAAKALVDELSGKLAKAKAEEAAAANEAAEKKAKEYQQKLLAAQKKVADAAAELSTLQQQAP